MQPMSKREGMAVDLSIIIVNWKSADYMRSCLASIYENTAGITYEVIVVDNASDDGSENIVNEHFPNALFFQSGENLGFACANNVGYARSSGKYLVFLNPDTEVVGNALGELLAHLRSDSSLGAVGPRLVNTDGSLQVSCVQAFPTIANQLLDSELLRRCFPSWKGWGTRAFLANSNIPSMVDVISGACFMVKKNVFDEVGWFSEQYFMYSDDLDLSYNIHAHGYSIRYLDNCRVIHHGGKSSINQYDHFSDLLQKGSMLQFFRKTKGRFYGGLYRLSVAVAATVRMAIIAMLMLCGHRMIQGRPAAVVLEKWSTLLEWAIGLNYQTRIRHKTEEAV